MENLASVATLFLFGVFLVGRFITIKKNRAMVGDKISLDISEEEKNGLNIIDEVSLADNPANSLFITSQSGIYSLSINCLQYDEGYNKVINRETVFEHSFLNIGQTLQINVTMAELINSYEITYFTWDYRMIIIPLYHNPKNGVVAEIAQPKHTYKSILYYFFQ